MLEIMTNEAESSAKIIVIGVGGAGNMLSTEWWRNPSAEWSSSVSIQINRL